MEERFTDGSTVIGVFDDAYQAERAISELSQSGFRNDQIEFSMSDSATIVGGYGTEEEPLLAGERSSQAVVRVVCGDREQEVSDLLHRYGAFDVRTLGSDAPTLRSTGKIRDIGSEGGRTESEGSAGSSYDTARGPGQIDAETPSRVVDTNTYNVDMTGSGEVKTGASSGAPIGDRPRGDRWEDVINDYRTRWQHSSKPGDRWEDYEPAYRYGWERSRMPEYRGRSWSESEPELRSDWEKSHSEKPWDRFVNAVRDAWENLKGDRDRGSTDRAA